MRKSAVTEVARTSPPIIGSVSWSNADTPQCGLREGRLPDDVLVKDRLARERRPMAVSTSSMTTASWCSACG